MRIARNIKRKIQGIIANENIETIIGKVDTNRTFVADQNVSNLRQSRRCIDPNCNANISNTQRTFPFSFIFRIEEKKLSIIY